MAPLFGASSDKDIMKAAIRELHGGAPTDELKQRLAQLLRNANSTDIAQAEEELIAEGMPAEEIRRLCDVHLAVFQDVLDKEKPIAPPGHPIHILMEEHKTLLGFAAELARLARAMEQAAGMEAATGEIAALDNIVEHLKASNSHYLREENVVFPYLDKHGISQPPKIMWMEHDQIREMEKGLYAVADSRATMPFKDFVTHLYQSSVGLSEMLSGHFYKENTILFPTAMRVVTEDEWISGRREFDEIGYCCFTPEPARVPYGAQAPLAPELAAATTGMVEFATGTLRADALERILNRLPVDITFVDADDRVAYFSQTAERIFVRTTAVLGRQVQHCHPQKSLDAVNKIVGEFKAGTRDSADFWINMNGRLIYIRYFPVRDEQGKYLGAVEVTQDITDIQKLTGEKRLLLD